MHLPDLIRVVTSFAWNMSFTDRELHTQLECWDCQLHILVSGGRHLLFSEGGNSIPLDAQVLQSACVWRPVPAVRNSA